MKIRCECGALIHDSADELPHKAHLIPDQDWNRFWDAIDDAIEKTVPSAKERGEACMRLRIALRAIDAYQCDECGRIYVEDRDNRLHVFAPRKQDTPKDLFRRR